MAINSTTSVRVVAALLGLVFFVSTVFNFGGCHSNNVPTATPQIVLDGPDITGIGEMLEYKATVKNTSEKVYLQWGVVKDGKEADYRISKEGSVLIGSGASPGKLLVIVNGVIVKRKYLVLNEVQELNPAFHTVTIGGDVPPNPLPPPAPTPDPGPTDGKYKIARLVYNTFNSSVTNKGTEVVDGVETPIRVIVAKSVANNYTTIAQSIDNNEFGTIVQIFTKLKELNTPCVTKYTGMDEEYTVYDKNIQAYIYQLFTNKTLGPVSDYADLFREIATGLNSIK